MHRFTLLFSSLIAIIFSGLASVIPIGLYNQGTVSSLYPTLFTPATFTFSIWSVIYISWILLGFYEAFGKSWIKKENVYLLASAQILSSIWLIPSQFLWIGSSFIVMLGVLYLLSISLSTSRDERWYFRYTLELFFGWILVASLANLHLTLVSYNIYMIPEILTYISILIALALNVFLLLKYNIFVPALVLTWALIGIILGQESLVTQMISGFSIVALIFTTFYNYKGSLK